MVEVVARLDSERDLAACAATCSTFRRATRTESVWRNPLRETIGGGIDGGVAETIGR